MSNSTVAPTSGYVGLLGNVPDGFERALKDAARDDIIHRVWKRDVTVWKGDPDLIANRLGWLSLPENTSHSLEKIERFVQHCRQTGAERFVLAGMGGSVLTSKVFRRAFSEEGFALTVLDTTVADAVAAACGELDYNKTFFIVSSKSGQTVETLSLADFFFERCSQRLGAAKAPERFAAITDSGTPLYVSAKRKNFAAVFEGNKTVGGRFSPLSFFGMVPAAVAGADVKKILSGAEAMARNLRNGGERDPNGNTALRLALAIDLFCKSGNGAFYVCCSDRIAGFDRFVEQIVGESVGKEGRSVLPVVHPHPSVPDGVEGAVFVCLKDDAELMSRARAAAAGGVAVVMTVLEDAHDLGGEIFRWEMAAAILGALWNVNPFDQPDVENAKKQARRFMKIYRESGALPFPPADFTDGDIEFRLSDSVPDAGRLRSYLAENALARKENGYFSIQAFLDDSDKSLRGAVESLRSGLSRQFGITVTADFGPAYLHSSGQIHKGGSGNGLFIQLCYKCLNDIKIPAHTPDSGGASFETLKDAQALGDKEALERKGRKVVQIRFASDAGGGVSRLIELLGIGNAS